MSANSFVVVNPLGEALSHYVDELTAVLSPSGTVSIVVDSITEPSRGGGRSAWLLKYVSALWRSSRFARPFGHRPHVIVVWPVLGYLDLILLRLLCGRGASLIVHDTRPLVRAVGYGRTSQSVASFCARPGSLLVHSDRAIRDIVSERIKRSALRVPHPMFRPKLVDRAILRLKEEVPVIRVLGQYKIDRDIEALRSIPTRLGDKYSYEVVGRGWPQIAGWTVKDEFVSEAELDLLLRTSQVVLIPYRRFYQSGIAARCLENCVAFVGPRDSVLKEMIGSFAPGHLVGADHDWSDAIAATLDTNPSVLYEASLRYYRNCIEEWSTWSAKVS